MDTKTEITPLNNEITNSVFSNPTSFDHWQRIAKALCSSTLVPKAYQNNISNTMVALELSNRVGVSPIMVMQNLDIISGKPSWSSSFIIAVLNSCGRFKPLRFVFEGQEKTDSFGCYAETKDLEGNVLRSPKITWAMVKGEGWLNRSNSKWKTMPELMFQYRAAAFFGRLYAPDILKGMHSIDEVNDINSIPDNNILLDQLRTLFMEKEELLNPEDKEHIERIIQNQETSSYRKAIKILEAL